MICRERDIVFERAPYWVLRVKNGFEVYETGATHSVRKAFIGFPGEVGLSRSKAEIERRISSPASSPFTQIERKSAGGAA